MAKKRDKLGDPALAARIRNARKAKGYKQHHVAAGVGVTVQAVSGWERAETDPSMENLMALAQFLECGLTTLMKGQDDPISKIEEKYYAVPPENRDMAGEHAGRTLDRWAAEDSDGGRQRKAESESKS